MLVFLGLLLTASMPIQAETRVVYTFGIVPQQSASKLARLWIPILKRISAETGFELNFKTAPSIPEFERRLADGEYDIAYMNPYHYTVFHDAPGYKAFAKQKDKMISGILITRKDSPIKTPAELKHKVLAFPAPAAFAASVLPRSYLKKAGIDFTPKYVSSHDSVYLGVAAGLYPAGGGIKRTFNNIDKTLQDQLRILWETEKFTPHAFAVHPRVEQEHIKVIAKVMFALEQDNQGKKLLSSINFKGIVPAKDSDWDDVRMLDINLIN